MIARLQLYGLIGLAFIAGLIGIYAAGIQRGVDKQKAKIDQTRLDNIAEAKKVENEIEILDDVGLSERASKWLRNKD